MFENWPVVEYDGICLKKVGREDAPFMEDLFEHPLSMRDCVRMQRAFENRFHEHSCIVLGIYEAGLFKGVIEAYGIHDGHCEIGYRVKPAYQSQGIATRAVLLMCGYLMNAGMKIKAHCQEGNEASRKVLMANGFRPTGNDGGMEYELCLVLDDPKEEE